MKKLFVMALGLMVAAAFAAPNKVKSKLGDIELTKEKGGGNVVCTAGFNDELTIVKDGDTDVLVKGSCGDGVNIDRDFKEYLQHTMDRETMEMHNNEN